METTASEGRKQDGAGTSEIKAGEFSYLPIDQIMINQQIRQNIDTGCDGFTGLMESIRERGVLEPPLVASGPDGTSYVLIAGERRLKACQMLGMTNIPVRIVDQAASKSDVITLQLIENLNREDLDPIDEARAYLEFFRAKMGDIDANGVISRIVTYERDPKRLKNDFAANFAAISKMTGKATRSMRYLFSLLNLPEAIQAAVKEGKIGLSQGYLFAANLGNPKLMAIFESVMKKPVTYEVLKKLLEAAAQTDAAKAEKKPFSGFYSQIRTLRTAFETGKAGFAKQDIEQLVSDLENFCLLLKEQAGALETPAVTPAADQPVAPEKPTGKKKTTKKKTA
ncbi:MAG: ParB/RepB/Spo0J family partition protein [Syntrophales bacterium]|nr:ParB/RepB/Spo0J family partition protein [Syntrophales bacterium]